MAIPVVSTTTNTTNIATTTTTHPHPNATPQPQPQKPTPPQTSPSTPNPSQYLQIPKITITHPTIKQKLLLHPHPPTAGHRLQHGQHRHPATDTNAPDVRTRAHSDVRMSFAPRSMSAFTTSRGGRGGRGAVGHSKAAACAPVVTNATVQWMGNAAGHRVSSGGATQTDVRHHFVDPRHKSWESGDEASFVVSEKKQRRWGGEWEHFSYERERQRGEEERRARERSEWKPNPGVTFEGMDGLRAVVANPGVLRLKSREGGRRGRRVPGNGIGGLKTRSAIGKGGGGSGGYQGGSGEGTRTERAEWKPNPYVTFDSMGLWPPVSSNPGVLHMPRYDDGSLEVREMLEDFVEGLGAGLRSLVKGVRKTVIRSWMSPNQREKLTVVS
ncbi:hypothetical protein BU24DRAFT_459265 [Aaosphaeria arxii CBS 175.79]|uniref:Uncharacterized protein n=1 Tax=Aaosphaeria arxii CBS 175.79 TaxID=1450172 RepID=A0A6A5Y265_9PLEO|nr:uncharacterized protein BU24DRAFT_459265 [Aaosphaeria arxii CBS 175.79]KAF2019612.1 hypothetical protein BU24DRAFT_459265 [Aaosphaeria arxii CBS 175.79]